MFKCILSVVPSDEQYAVESLAGGGENGDDSYRMTSSKNDDLTESNGHKIDIKSATSCGVVGQTLHRHRNYLSQTETNARNVGALLHALRCHSSAQRVKNGLRNCADAWD